MKINFFYNKKNLRILSDLIILFFSLVAVYFRDNIYDFSIITYYSIIFILFIFATLSFYDKLYQWRNLERSVSSFIFFSINILQLFLYLFGIRLLFNMFYYNISSPIYLDDLSILSQYRYLFLSVISFFFIFGFIIIRLFGISTSNFSFWTYPHLKEEVRKILDTWNDSFMINIFNKIIDRLYFSFLFRIIYFIVNFIFFSMVRLITTTLLFYCVFLNGDFRKFLYLTPLFFLVWLASFFHYSFIIYQKDSTNYIRNLISATPKSEGKKIWGVIKIDPSQISFQLTEKAISEGFCEVDMYNLTKEWYIQAQITAYFHVYYKLILYINYFINIINLFIWLYISYNFFILPSKDSVLFGGILGWLNSINKVYNRTYATQARRVLPHYQKKLTEETAGAHQGNHPALVDPLIRDPDNPNRILYEGQPTHGPGSTANPSYPLHPSKDLQGNPRPQHFVPPPSSSTFVDESGFDPNPTRGSQTFMNDPKVKENFAKHSPRDENT